jgi:mono/diheme cytochrome c family protein
MAMKGIGLSALVVAAGLAAGCERAVTASTDGREAAKPPTAAAETAAERGRYLVNGIGCHDCHTPKKMGQTGPELDAAMLLAGHVASDQLPPPPAVQKGPWIATGSWDLTAWSGPWGISYATNLTPDHETGLGQWTEEMFVQALKTGKHMGVSRPILPPMPWQAFRNLTDADLKAMFAYLRTVPPIKNRVPDPVFASLH